MAVRAKPHIEDDALPGYALQFPQDPSNVAKRKPAKQTNANSNVKRSIRKIKRTGVPERNGRSGGSFSGLIGHVGRYVNTSGPETKPLV
jgi:hypothetical protein